MDLINVLQDGNVINPNRSQAERITTTGILVLCLVFSLLSCSPAFAGGDQLQGDKGAGTVRRAAWDEPWFRTTLTLFVTAGLAAGGYLLLRRARKNR